MRGPLYDEPSHEKRLPRVGQPLQEAEEAAMRTPINMLRSNGFTLIELLIAIAILAIIMGIAIPSYTQYVLESGRAEAKSGLMQAAQMLERCYTRNSEYSNCPGAASYPDSSENDKYDISIAVEDGGAAFTVTATPKGSQTKDTDCPSFALDEIGLRYIDGGREAADLDECW